MRAVLARLVALMVVVTLPVLGLPGSAPPVAAQTACTVPSTFGIRDGLQATFDQCLDRSFTVGTTTYTVRTYYTEQSTATNTNRCAPTVPAIPADRCEHALANGDDAAGNNRNAVAMAAEAEAALRFYLARNLDPLGAGVVELRVLIADDYRLGGVPDGTTIQVDDESIDNTDVLNKRLLAFHELMHLVQDKRDGTIGWGAWYGEGIARAIEDRADTALDADTGHLFIPEVNGHLSSDGERTGDFLSQSYRTVLWWTWLFDRYRATGDGEPTLGWDAIRRFFAQLTTAPDQLTAASRFIAGEGSSFRADFLDYSRSLWAYRYASTNERLGYLDTQVQATAGLRGHTVITGGPAYNAAAQTPAMVARSSRYYEFNPASQCQYTSFTFNGNGRSYGWSVMAADGGNLVDERSSYGTTWARTVRTADLDRAVGTVTSVDQAGTVNVGYGCVGAPTVNIVRPTTAAVANVGRATRPRTFILRLDVNGADGSPVAGLNPDDFLVDLRLPTGGPFLPAFVVNGAQVQDDYWLLVQAPSAAVGAANGEFYDLRVRLDTASDTEPSSVLYVERAADTMLVVDRSGSMADDGKIVAARNAARLFANELADTDAGGLVGFDTDAQTLVTLRPAADGRIDLEQAIETLAPLAATSIGDGMRTAAEEEALRGIAGRPCNLVLLSDGMENSPDLWETVRPGVVDNGCAHHVVGLGGGANEVLLQQIAAAGPGGSYDFAEVLGGGGAKALSSANPALSWQNNLGRIYDWFSAQAAGRQRVFSAVGAPEPQTRIAADISRLVGFEDLPTGAQYGPGDTFASVSVPFAVTDLPGPQTTDEGTVTVGAAAECCDRFLVLAAAGLAVDLGTEAANRVELYYSGAEAFTLQVNGETASGADPAELNGTTLGGATIAADDGQLSITGAIDDLAVGGTLTLSALRYTLPSGHRFTIDDTSQRLVVSTSWQSAAEASIQLYAPDGTPVDAAFNRRDPYNTNDVWDVPDPAPGVWRLDVTGLGQQHYVSAQSDSLIELHLFPGTPVAELGQGVTVPLVALLSGSGAPLPGAAVTATVTDPSGHTRAVALRDDGNSGDGAAGDGVYGGTYTATSLADSYQPDPAQVVDGAEPDVVGSYGVEAVAVLGDVRREAQASFAIDGRADDDGDGLPTPWELEVGLDPAVPDDTGDPDRDGLVNSCEFTLGTHPTNADTDGGGESDGSEVPVPGTPCRAGTQDPLDPDDDRIDPLLGVQVIPMADPDDSEPFLEIVISPPLEGELVSVDIFCRARDANGAVVQDWALVADDHVGTRFVLRPVQAGLFYECEVVPTVRDAEGEPRTGPGAPTEPVEAKTDPYPPAGAVLIEGGAEVTADLVVALGLSAGDSGPTHDGAPADPRQGTPADQLEMRLSNTADFSGAVWEPFRAEVPDWNLGDVAPGAVATVYVQFRDAAGNVGDQGLGHVDTIVYNPDGGPLPGPGPSPGPGPGVERLRGADRYETAVEIATDAYESATTAVLARGDAFPDALAGTYLAGQLRAPLLLTRPGDLPSVTADALVGLGVTEVVLLGGTQAISPAVEAQLAAGYAVERIGGADRYATAALVVQQEGGTVGEVDGDRTALLASGENFPDALVVGGLAYEAAFPLVLTGQVTLPAATADALAALEVDRVVVPGGEVAVAAAVTEQLEGTGVTVERLRGAERTETAVRVAEFALTRLAWDPTHASIARGDAFPDALAMGPHVGEERSPLLLTVSPDVTGTAEAYLAAHRCELTDLHIAGGTAAVSVAVEQALVAAATPNAACGTGPAAARAAAARAAPQVPR